MDDFQVSQGVVMNTIFLGLITLGILVLIGFIISVIVEYKRTAIRLRETIDSVEKTVIPTIDELKLTIISVRKITDDVGSVSEDIKELSGSVKEISSNISNTSEAVRGLAIGSAQQISGVKAGVKAGLVYFLTNMFVKR